MNQLAKPKPRLPATTHELDAFVLVGNEQLKAYRAQLRAVDQIKLAKGIRDQTLRDAWRVAEQVFYAEAKLGELLGNGNLVPQREPNSGRGRPHSLPDGMTKKRSHNAQLVARHTEIIESVLAEARDKDDIPTLYALLRAIRAMLRPPRETPDLPDGIFQVLYADPPWDYSNSGFDQSAAQHYPTMPTPDICTLKDKRDRAVNDLAANDSVLFLWVTSPLLPDGLAVMEDWGFEYKADMIWIKDRAPGVGWWVMTKHEILLIGSRGSFLPEKKPDSVIGAPVGRHSDKPDIFYEIIESMYPEAKRVELFARDPREGWTVWGNEL